MLEGGIVTGWADTPVQDPYGVAPNCFIFSCFVAHTFIWKDGVLRDLGALRAGRGSHADWIDAHDRIAGSSQIGPLDPVTHVPEQRAVLWQNGEQLDLGTLGGSESGATGVNASGEVTGVASNAIADPFSFLNNNQQTRAFLWKTGEMRDIGTLGGPDAFGQIINERGQIAGFSYTNNVPNGSTGMPTVDPFLWDPEQGRMLDLGSLGGTFGAVGGLNGRGDVIGNSNGPGDNLLLPFLWHDGRLANLGTFGSFATPTWINDKGDVVGFAGRPDGATVSAALWRNGALYNLGTLAGEKCAFAYGINQRRQIVGTAVADTEQGYCFWGAPTDTAMNAVLWENGAIIDLNDVIPSHPNFHLAIAFEIDGRGEIAGIGLPRGVAIGDVQTRGRVFVLIPCRGERERDCEQASSGEEGSPLETAALALPPTRGQVHAPAPPRNAVERVRAMIARRYHLPNFMVPQR